MRRDYPANNKVGIFYAQARRTAGAAAYISTAIDHASGRAGRVHGYEWSTVLMCILYVTRWPAVGAGTITITIQHSNTGVAGTYAAYATVAAATEASGEDLYIFEIRDFRRYVRLSAIVAGGTCDFNCLGVFDRSRGEPVYQDIATELAVTVTGTP